MRRFPKDVVLRLEYLNFIRRNDFSKFSIGRLRALYSRHLGELAQQRETCKLRAKVTRRESRFTQNILSLLLDDAYRDDDIDSGLFY